MAIPTNEKDMLLRYGEVDNHKYQGLFLMHNCKDFVWQHFVGVFIVRL